MPASPATPRRSTKNRRSAPATTARLDAESSQPLALSDSNSVRDRIRQWQEQGAKFVSPPVIGEVSAAGDENADVDAPLSPPLHGREPTRDPDTTPRRRVRWADPDKKEWVRERRSSSTPRKRVVSDEHWKQKQKRSPQLRQHAAAHQIAQGKELSEMPIQASSNREQEERRQRRRNARSSATKGTINDSSPVIELRTPPPSAKRHSGEELGAVQSDVRGGVVDDLPRKLQSRTPPKRSPRDGRTGLRLSPRMDDKPIRQSQYAEMLDKSAKPAHVSFDDPTDSIRSRKGGILSQAKEMFSRAEPVPPTSQRLPSIEAWLDEQPDPFTDGNPEPVEIPAPLKMRSNRQKLDSGSEILQDPDETWKHVEPIDPKPDHMSGIGRRRQRTSRRSQGAPDTCSPESADAIKPVEKSRRMSSASQDKAQEPQDESPSGLKRRGAKALRAKTGSVPIQRTSPEHGSRRIRGASFPRASISTGTPLSGDEQPTPARLCPSTGAHRLSTIASVETFQSHTGAAHDTDNLVRDEKGLPQRLTTHEDLMSVLSTRGAGGSVKSARSVRTAKSRMATATLDEVLEELEMDEARYMRELKTLVGGVIPVLLQCVLSKSDSAAAAGLFSSSGSARDDLNFTKPIVDMGVALERLKTLHKRIPTRDVTALLSWAQSAHKIYIDYLKAWRLGFQNVVVNLAPRDENTKTDVDEGMARDENGDVVNSVGKKVDVAYLLKRPLVRIKHLAKVFGRLKTLKPTSKASFVADSYDDLIKTARKRSNEEQSRLEDEAAANIDASKCRDLRTLAVLSGVEINRSRIVKARDCFGLTIHHSSGQRLDCHIELLLRESQPGLHTGGDLLVCEIENNGRWLLFPPLETESLSARHGDNAGEIVVMARAHANYVHEWHELLVLKTSDSGSASEWVSMLGTQPVPPGLNRTSSFNNGENRGATSVQQNLMPTEKLLPLIPRSPSRKEVEVPIGEPSVIDSEEGGRPRTAPDVYQIHNPSPYSADIMSHEQPLPVRVNQQVPSPSHEHEHITMADTTSPTLSPGLHRSRMARRRRAQPVESASSGPLIASSPTPFEQPLSSSDTGKISRTDDASRERMSSPNVQRAASRGQEESTGRDLSNQNLGSRHQRPQYQRAISSTPSKELPTINRIRSDSPVGAPVTSLIPDQGSALWVEAERSKHEKRSTRDRPTGDRTSPQCSNPRTSFTDDGPSPPPHRSQSPSPSAPRLAQSGSVPSAHRSSPQGEQAEPVAILKPQPQSAPRKGPRNDRRSSSPLKHEYAPSTTSVSSESDDESITSSSFATSEDDMLEQDDVPTPLPSLKARELQRTSKVPPPASLPNLPGGSLAPSNSASQAPYRTVPHLGPQANAPTSKTIATVCSWSDKGVWESLCPDECSVVVSPGLIEAYEMSAAHSGARTMNDDGNIADGSSCTESDAQGVRPLVAFELTPLVPLRRGTALDISIRSPPTPRSKVQTSSNIMFRSRNAEECEGLYAMINYARINNPTWIALENARPREMPHVTFNTGPGSARHSRSRSKSGSWFGIGSLTKRSSYRASSAPPPGSSSADGMSETSVGSISSALSALRRFSGGASDGKRAFNLNRSSVLRKNGRFGIGGSASLYSSSSGTTRTEGSGSGATSPAPSQRGLAPLAGDRAVAPAGAAPSGTINNMKVRLYVRESAARWKDMGAARLSIMPATVLRNESGDGPGASTEYDPSPPTTAADPRSPSSPVVGQAGQARGPRLPSSNHTPHRVHGNGTEKRILITGKTKGETLLDATLHESCFERIARTGIAVNVWEERAEVAKVGGVAGGKGRTYMVQMKGEAEAAWAFGMLGRLRY